MQVIGIDHHRADTATIARLGRAADALRDALAREPSVAGLVVLATCARVEAYVDSPRAHDAQRAFVRSLAEATGTRETDLSALVRVHRGVDALEHAFRVTSGLESAVVGESQIAGQVRAALASGRGHGTVNRSIGMALENAVRVSRLARGILGTPGMSIADVALDLLPADHRVGTALVIGTGSFARECVAALRAHGAHTVWSHSPSGRREPIPGVDDLITRDELVPALGLSDVVVAASGGSRTVLDRRTVAAAVPHAGGPLMILDLAGGADVDADVDALVDASVIRLSDVHRPSARADAAGDLVRREALSLFPRLASSDLDDLVVAIRRTVEESMADEIERATDPQSRARLRRMTQALLHEPTERARQAAREGRLDQFRAAMETVFGPLTDPVVDRLESAQRDGTAA